MKLYLHDNKVLLAWLVGDRLLFWNCGPYGVIVMNLCSVLTVAVVMLLGILALLRYL
jgi:hypothetical protein